MSGIVKLIEAREATAIEVGQRRRRLPHVQLPRHDVRDQPRAVLLNEFYLPRGAGDGGIEGSSMVTSANLAMAACSESGGTVTRKFCNIGSRKESTVVFAVP